jgi:RNA polymerase sigma factor (sigma-70 family)
MSLDTPTPPSNANFSATHWSLVLRAADEARPGAEEALTELCQRYWYPLYAYVRRRGNSSHDAQDLTQSFFARLLEKKLLERVDPAKGKFRSFLLASLKHFLSDEWDKARAQKRGGVTVTISIDEAVAENLYGQEPKEGLSPDQLYERRWAMTLLDRTMARIEMEYRNGGKGELFERLHGSLLGVKEASYAEIGRGLGMGEGAVKVAAHRIRKRFRRHLREEIALTVGEQADIDAEIQELFAALRA